MSVGVGVGGVLVGHGEVGEDGVGDEGLVGEEGGGGHGLVCSGGWQLWLWSWCDCRMGVRDGPMYGRRLRLNLYCTAERSGCSLSVSFRAPRLCECPRRFLANLSTGQKSFTMLLLSHQR